MAALQTVTLTADVPVNLAVSLGLAPGDRQAGDVLQLSNSDARALISADVARYGSAAQDADTVPTDLAGAAVTVEPDPVAAAVAQATRDATLAVKAADEAQLAILQQRASALGNAHLVSGSQQRWREEFANLDDWVVTSTGMAAPTLSGGVMTVVSGTTAGGEVVMLSKRRFSAPVKLAVSFAMSQKIANHDVLMEFVADDDTDTAAVDETTVASWRFSGSDNTTSTAGRYEVLNGVGARQGVTVTTVADHVGATPKAVAEVQLESDETRWYTRVLNSANGRSSGNVRQDVSPDPARMYRVRLRFTNRATAPASTTTTTVSSVVVTDYTELNVEVTGSRGATTQDEALGVNVANTPNVNVANVLTLNDVSNETQVTSTALTALQSVNHATIDEGASAGIRSNRTRVMVQATAAALGSITNLILQESEDNTTFRDVWRCPIPVDGQVHTFDLPLRTRYRRWVSTNGATALTAYLVKERGVRFDGAADIDKVLSFPLTPAAGQALAVSAAYTSPTLDLGANHLWDRARFLAVSDQATISGGFYVQQSVDGTNWIGTQVVGTTTPGSASLLESPIIGRYIRMVFANNTTTAATAFRAFAALVSL